MFYFSERSKNNLKGVHPTLQLVLEEAIKFSPYDFKITAGFRTTKDQQFEYSKGRTLFTYVYKGITYKYNKVTKCDGIIHKSNHQAKNDGFGYAVDIAIATKDESELYNLKKIEAVARHVQKVAKKYGVKISWGGDWEKYKDYPHLEFKK